MRERHPIPNINIGQVYDQRYADADIHYEALGKLADFFGRNMRAHWHDRFFQLHYVKSGMVHVYLDDRHFRHEGPMFFFTPPTWPHAFATQNGSEGHVLTVRQELVWPVLEEVSGLPRGQVSPVCVALGALDGEYAREGRRLGTLLDTLGEEFFAGRPGRDQALAALMRLSLISILRLAAQTLKPNPARREDLHLFERFNELIEQHYHEHWSLQSYAQALGVTGARLNDICRRVADLPSKRLVFDRLMQEAKRLLLFTGSSVNEICYQLGFKDPGYFNRFFSRNAGMTPGEYRLRNERREAWVKHEWMQEGRDRG